jgi:hypothetical protein
MHADGHAGTVNGNGLFVERVGTPRALRVSMSANRDEAIRMYPTVLKPGPAGAEAGSENVKNPADKARKDENDGDPISPSPRPPVRVQLAAAEGPV